MQQRESVEEIGEQPVTRSRPVSFSSERESLADNARRHARTLSNAVEESHLHNGSFHNVNESEVLKFIREDIIGNDSIIHTPMGERRLTYCDYVASGRGMRSVEHFLQTNVLPTYANTHTDASFTGRRTNQLREQAREMVAKSCGVNQETHAVIFTGSGCTGAIDTFVSLLPPPFQQNGRVTSDLNQGDKSKIPAVIISVFEHHSNILPWRESNADVFTCRSDKSGEHGVDLDHLDEILSQLKKERRPLVIGSFSAASNVDGTLVDVALVADALKRNGALAFFDYAAAGPYVPVRVEDHDLDGVFISPHKFIGGPCTPGVLVARRSVIGGDNLSVKAPHRPGGGSVVYVTHAMHAYEQKAEIREEAGTPDIVGSIRAGLVFSVKDQIGAAFILEREEQLLERARTRLAKCENLVLLGNPKAKRLPTLSFLISVDKVLYVHQNFVCSLLNDLFGIQSRSGCACAGPYGSELLGIDAFRNNIIMTLFAREKSPILKPGFTRVNLPFFAEDDQIDFLLDAIAWVSENAFKLMPLYTMDIHSSTFKAKESKHFLSSNLTSPELPSLFGFDLLAISKETSSVSDTSKVQNHPTTAALSEEYKMYFKQANKLVKDVEEALNSNQSELAAEVEDPLSHLDDQAIWFMRPHQATTRIVKGTAITTPPVPLFWPSEEPKFEPLLKSLILQTSPVDKSLLNDMVVEDYKPLSVSLKKPVPGPMQGKAQKLMSNIKKRMLFQRKVNAK